MDFCGKISIRQKWPKNGQKPSKKRVLGFLKKTKLLVLSGIGVKRKYGPLTFCEKCMPEKNLVLKLCGQKWFLPNEISVFFNYQYFIDSLISDFDFWNVDRNEWKQQGLLRGFLKKNACLVKWVILGPKMADPHNSRLALRIFLKFCTVTRGNR